VTGTAGVNLEGVVFHSNIGGKLRCTRRVGRAPGWNGVVVHDAGWARHVDDNKLCGSDYQ
jgi:hypothetical protein